jgi:hypothetical protein
VAALLLGVLLVVGVVVVGMVEICFGGGGWGEGKLEVRRVLGDVGEVLSDEVMGAWERASVASLAVEGKGEGDAGSDDGSESLGWEDGGDDFTACSGACDYCGNCTY